MLKGYPVWESIRKLECGGGEEGEGGREGRGGC